MNQLRKLREAKKLSQFELAKLSNVNPADISKLENSKTFAYPGWRKRIAEALEVTEQDIWPCS